MKDESIAVESIRLATLLELEQLLREATDEASWGFTLANETLRLMPYRQAIVLKNPGRYAQVSQVSGVSSVERDAPKIRWLKQLSQTKLKDTPLQGTEEDIPGNLLQGWKDWGSSHWLYLPLCWPKDQKRPLAGLLLLRDQQTIDAEFPLIERLVEAAAHALHSLRGGKRSPTNKPLRGRLITLGLCAVLIASFFIPVRQSVLAPAEVGTRHPHVVTSPQDGVIKTVNVLPNQTVAPGDILFRLDDTLPRNQLAVAEKALSVAESQHRQAVQGAFVDARHKADIAIMSARIEKTRAELEQAREILERSVVRAERDGIAIFPDATALTGRPVQVGERVMELAEPRDANLVAWVAVADAIEIPSGSAIRFFLNTSPDQPLEAELTQVAYQAVQSPSGILSFEIRGQFHNFSSPPRIGLRGTARIYGKDVSLFRYLMRRPLAFTRPWLGF